MTDRDNTTVSRPVVKVIKASQLRVGLLFQRDGRVLFDRYTVLADNNFECKRKHDSYS